MRNMRQNFSTGHQALSPLHLPGEVLYKYAKEILTLYASVEKAIGSMGLLKGSLTVGAGSNIGNYILPSVITDFKNIHSKIKITSDQSAIQKEGYRTSQFRQYRHRPFRRRCFKTENAC
jgi:hypothetical protein